MALKHNGKIVTRLWAAVASLALLSGCGGVAALSALAGVGNQGIDLNAVSRKQMEGFGTPILRATVAARGLDLLMSPRDSRADVVTWESAEGITLAFRSGMLIESRGLGADLMSSAAPAPSQVLGGGPYARTYFFVSDDDRNERRDYTCTTEVVGTETVTIYGRAHSTRHVRESCLRDVGRITNDFWFEGSTLRKSRQWLSPDAGYVDVARVVD